MTKAELLKGIQFLIQENVDIEEWLSYVTASTNTVYYLSPINSFDWNETSNSYYWMKLEAKYEKYRNSPTTRPVVTTKEVVPLLKDIYFDQYPEYFI